MEDLTSEDDPENEKTSFKYGFGDCIQMTPLQYEMFRVSFLDESKESLSVIKLLISFGAKHYLEDEAGRVQNLPIFFQNKDFYNIPNRFFNRG